MSRNKRKTAVILNGAVLLTIAGLITKILSAGYRIPYHHITGDVGFYIYQQVYPIYGMVLLISTYGFPVVISKLIAEQIELANYKSIRKVLMVSFTFLFMLNVGLFFIQFLGAHKIAWLMGDLKLTILIKTMAFASLITPFIAVIRGYYQGHQDMLPTATSQVAEQIVRVVTILLASYLFLKAGYSLYMAGVGAVLGSITGALASIVVLLAFFRKRVFYPNQPIKKSISVVEILKQLFMNGTLMCLSSMGLILLQLIDSFTIYSQLTTHHMLNIDAKIAKGIYDRGLPLIQLGTVVGTAFSLSLVPVISSAFTKRDRQALYEKIHLSLRVAFVVGVGAAFGLVGIMNSTNTMLFGDDAGSFTLQILSLLILFTTLASTLAAILQGIGSVYAPAIAIIVGACIKWIGNVWLIPLFGITGSALASVVAFLAITGCNIYALRKKIALSYKIQDFLSPLLAGGCMLALLLGHHELFLRYVHIKTVWSSVLEAFSGVAIGGVVYLVLILQTNVFAKREIELLPLGSKLAKLKNNK
ncbi:putative polysaccharide biosynthesis protein [Priestia koreensis]|uniref:putative polysaccharide biosynthesis protein n=1 Tax=Priestia koreensis TaxID=284581 RepID=UPI003D030D34